MDGNGLWCTQEEVGEVRRVRGDAVSHTGGAMEGAQPTNPELYLADIAESGHGDADIGAKSLSKSKVTLA